MDTIWDDERPYEFDEYLLATPESLDSPAFFENIEPEQEYMLTPESCTFENEDYFMFQREEVELVKIKPSKKRQAKLRIEYKPILQDLLRDTMILDHVSKKLKKGIYKCSHCPMSFKSLIEYVSHLDEFKIEKKFKCSNMSCPYKIIGFTRRAELKRHFESQHHHDHLHNLEFEGFNCNYQYCYKNFPRKDSLLRHEKLCHLNKHSRFNIRIKKMMSRHEPKKESLFIDIPVEESWYEGI